MTIQSSIKPNTNVHIISELPYKTIINNNNKLLISHDYGATWRSPITSPPENVYISAVCIGEKIQICLGKFDFIYRSEDNGENWLKSSNQPQLYDWSFLNISKNDEKIEAKTTNGIIYTSLDLGINWIRNE